MIINEDAILISFSKFQEQMFIAECFSKSNGLVKGIIKIPKKGHGFKTHPGSIIHINWKARLGSHLGHLKVETYKSAYANVFLEKHKVLFLSSALGLVRQVLNEHENASDLYNKLITFLDILQYEYDVCVIAKCYILLELAIIDQSGFGLDLGKCVVTNKPDNLAYLSPKSGCAVSSEVGRPYESKLFRLPAFFSLPDAQTSLHEITEAFKITTFFLKQRIFSQQHTRIPPSRFQLESYITELPEKGLYDAKDTLG